MIGLVLVIACGSGWRSVDVPSDQFSPQAVVAWSEKEAVLAGGGTFSGGALIYRLEGETIRSVLQREDGYIAALAHRDDRVWAVLGVPRSDKKPGSAYALLRSEDRGKTWATVGVAPFDSVSRAFALTRDELWLHTTNGLARSEDGGVTWDVVVAPGTRSPFDESLAAVDGGVALLRAESIVTRDGGETWEPLDVGGELVAADDGWFLGRHEGVIALYTPAREWIALPADERMDQPLTVDVDGSVVRVLVAEDPERQTIQLLTSGDGGRNWTRERVGAHTFGPIWALAPDGSALVFAPGDQNVLVKPPG